MKRWITPLGRGGSVLVAVGLALLLVSLLPTAQMGYFYEARPVQPEEIYLSYLANVLTPQNGLRLNVTANGMLNVYLLEVSHQTIYDWLSGHYPDVMDLWNITYFEEFLEANKGSIGRQDEIHNGRLYYEYVPTKITNATVVFSNPSQDITTVEYEAFIMGLVAPASKVRTLAQWTIPIGFLAALPWLIQSLRAKITRHGS